jgi:hypothetical protein
VEVLHVVGDILTKISVNCVIKLHVALLFTCVFLWVYLMCGYNCLHIYGFCLYMLPVYAASICLLLFQYESIHLRNVFFCLRFIYNVPKEFDVYIF